MPAKDMQEGAIAFLWVSAEGLTQFMELFVNTCAGSHPRYQKGYQKEQLRVTVAGQKVCFMDVCTVLCLGAFCGSSIYVSKSIYF